MTSRTNEGRDTFSMLLARRAPDGDIARGGARAMPPLARAVGAVAERSVAGFHKRAADCWIFQQCAAGRNVDLWSSAALEGWASLWHPTSASHACLFRQRRGATGVAEARELAVRALQHSPADRDRRNGGGLRGGPSEMGTRLPSKFCTSGSRLTRRSSGCFGGRRS